MLKTGKSEAEAGVQPRRRKPTRRAEILAAAREVFLRNGYEASLVSEIAAGAGCVEGTLYTYFTNKRALFDAVLTEFYDQLIAEIAPRFDAIDGTRDRLTFLIARHLQIALEDPAQGRLISGEVHSRAGYYGSTLHALNRHYSRFLMQTLHDGVKRGELRPGLDLSLARDLIFGGVEHWVWNTLERGQTFEPAAVARAIVAMVLDGWSTGTGEQTQVVELGRRVERLERRLAQAAAHKGSEP